MAHNIMKLGIMTFSINGLYAVLSIRTPCAYCHCAVCLISFIVMQNVTMLSVVMLTVVALFGTAKRNTTQKHLILSIKMLNFNFAENCNKAFKLSDIVSCGRKQFYNIDTV
jgi:hypothetical protein